MHLRNTAVLVVAIAAAAYAQPPASKLPPIPTTVPASTLTTPATPSKALDADGFIPRWIILEPIPASGLTDAAELWEADLRRAVLGRNRRERPAGTA